MALCPLVRIAGIQNSQKLGKVLESSKRQEIYFCQGGSFLLALKAPKQANAGSCVHTAWYTHSKNVRHLKNINKAQKIHIDLIIFKTQMLFSLPLVVIARCVFVSSNPWLFLCESMHGV
jgi:hypothetical protein